MLKALLYTSLNFFHFLSSPRSDHLEEKFYRWDLVSPNQQRTFFLSLLFSWSKFKVRRLYNLKFMLIDPIPKKPKVLLLSLLDLFSGHFSYHLFVTRKNCGAATTSEICFISFSVTSCCGSCLNTSKGLISEGVLTQWSSTHPHVSEKTSRHFGF